MLNTSLTSLVIVHSALIHKESRGAHLRLDYPEDYPEENGNWIKNTRILYKDNKFKYEML
jgi:succinate dehydrogenase/fumarate reductase flavoprotein subunit